MSTEPTPSLVLHHLVNSRSQRILWLLEELGIPYEIKRYERLPNKLAPPELLKISPLGKAPIITDGDVTLAESGAIVEYLLTTYGGDKHKPQKDGFIDNLYYSHYSEGTLMPLLSWKYILSLAPGKAPLFIRPIARAICGGLSGFIIEPQLGPNVEMISKQLDKHPDGWLAGGPEPTSADFMMLFPVEIMGSRVSKPLPQSIKDYVKRIHDRPAYKRALEKGGAYAYAEM